MGFNGKSESIGIEFLTFLTTARFYINIYILTITDLYTYILTSSQLYTYIRIYLRTHMHTIYIYLYVYTHTHILYIHATKWLHSSGVSTGLVKMQQRLHSTYSYYV